MNEEKEAAIRNVSDTALWVAMYRAMESERADALFYDPYARVLAGERGEEDRQADRHAGLAHRGPHPDPG